MGELPRLGMRGLVFLLSITHEFVVYNQRSFLFLRVLRKGCFILLWHILSRLIIIYELNRRQSSKCIINTIQINTNFTLKIIIIVAHPESPYNNL